MSVFLNIKWDWEPELLVTFMELSVFVPLLDIFVFFFYALDCRIHTGMSPLEYLQRHCIISARRMAHCKKIFVRHDKDKDSQINRQVYIT